MAYVRTRPVLAAALITLLGSQAPAGAQAEGTWLCRVRFEDQTSGGDTLRSTGAIELTNAAPQLDGSAIYMGRGPVDIVFTPARGCQATSGGTARVTMMAIVTTEDGETAEVDIAPAAEDSFPVDVRCGPNRSHMEVGVSAPPMVTLPLSDGASAAYSESSRSSFGSRGGQSGTVSLEFCRPEAG